MHNLPDTPTIKGSFAAICSAVSYGLLPVFSKLLVTANMDSSSLIVGQGIIGSIPLLLLLIIQKTPLTLSGAQRKSVLLIGLADGATTYLLYESYKRIDVGFATTIHFIYPVLVMLLMTLLFKETITIRRMIALFFAMVGIFSVTENMTGNLTGTLLAAGSACTYAIYNAINQKSAAGKIPPLLVSFYDLIIVSILFSCMCAIEGGLSLPHTSAEWGFFFTDCAIKVSGVSLAIYAMQTIGSTKTSILSTAELLTAIAAGVIVFHESLSIRQLFGCGTILTSVIILILEHDASRDAS